MNGFSLWNGFHEICFFLERKHISVTKLISLLARKLELGGSIGREKLIAHQRLPGEKVLEYDVVTRKKVPFHEEREIFEGPASYEVYQSPAREYVADYPIEAGNIHSFQLLLTQLI